MAFHAGLKAHLESGATTLCHAWSVVRRDGVMLGFIDHDRDLAFDGMVFRADSGLSALALTQGTGLSVDNSEAIGALTGGALTEADIEAGRFDGAALRCWLVNWAEVAERQLIFRGTMGEIRRAGGAFRAELRGLTEALNVERGRVYQRPCGAVLGDAACGVDLDAPGYATELPAEGVVENVRFDFAALNGFEPGWFTRGQLVALSGAGAGLRGSVKRDRVIDGVRRVELWTPLRAEIAPGDLLRLEAGCDKRFETCRLKFDNGVNFQGFPDIPGEDWVMVQPVRSGEISGGSRR